MQATTSPVPAIVDYSVVELHRELDGAQLDFLKLEYQNFANALLNNEELGERRFTIFVGLVGAATAGFGLAIDTLRADPPLFLGSIAVVSGGLLAFGLATLRRIMERNLASTEFLTGIALIRSVFIARAPSVAPLFLYVPSLKPSPRRQAGWGLDKAGLFETVALTNCVLVIICVASAASYVGIPIGVGVAAGVAASVVAWIAQLAWARGTYTRGTAAFDGGRAKAILAWRGYPGAPVWFRAGVGLVVVRSDGRLLVLERSDSPGDWQIAQGGLTEGEDAETAAWRELFEETGLSENHVELANVTEGWFGYELPLAFRNPKTGRGQVHHWFCFRLRDEVELPQLPDGRRTEFRASRWVTAREALDGAIEFRRAEYAAALGALGLMSVEDRAKEPAP